MKKFEIITENSDLELKMKTLLENVENIKFDINLYTDIVDQQFLTKAI